MKNNQASKHRVGFLFSWLFGESHQLYTPRDFLKPYEHISKRSMRCTKLKSPLFSYFYNFVKSPACLIQK